MSNDNPGCKVPYYAFNFVISFKELLPKTVVKHHLRGDGLFESVFQKASGDKHD